MTCIKELTVPTKLNVIYSKRNVVVSCNMLCDFLQDLQLGQLVLCIKYDKVIT